jgi:hypothetical protein
MSERIRREMRLPQVAALIPLDQRADRAHLEEDPRGDARTEQAHGDEECALAPAGPERVRGILAGCAARSHAARPNGT